MQHEVKAILFQKTVTNIKLNLQARGVRKDQETKKVAAGIWGEGALFIISERPLSSDNPLSAKIGMLCATRKDYHVTKTNDPRRHDAPPRKSASIMSEGWSSGGEGFPGISKVGRFTGVTEVPVSVILSKSSSYPGVGGIEQMGRFSARRTSRTAGQCWRGPGSGVYVKVRLVG